MKPLFLDPAPYSPTGEFLPEEGEDKIRLECMRSDNPELAAWSLEQISSAWGDYSKDCCYAGYMELPAFGRQLEFLAYIYGKQHDLLQPSRASYSEEVDRMLDWLLAEKMLS